MNKIIEDEILNLTHDIYDYKRKADILNFILLFFATYEKKIVDFCTKWCERKHGALKQIWSDRYGFNEDDLDFELNFFRDCTGDYGVGQLFERFMEEEGKLCYMYEYRKIPDKKCVSLEDIRVKELATFLHRQVNDRIIQVCYEFIDTWYRNNLI